MTLTYIIYTQYQHILNGSSWLVPIFDQPFLLGATCENARSCWLQTARSPVRRQPFFCGYLGGESPIAKSVLESHKISYKWEYILWLFNIAMEAMAHRNRWFTWLYRAVPTTSKQQPLCRNSSLTVGLAIGCFSPVAKQIRIDQ